MALYHKWDVKNDIAYVLVFFSLISDNFGSVHLYGSSEMYTCSQVLLCYVIFTFARGDGIKFLNNWVLIAPTHLQGSKFYS